MWIRIVQSPNTERVILLVVATLMVLGMAVGR